MREKSGIRRLWTKECPIKRQRNKDCMVYDPVSHKNTAIYMLQLCIIKWHKTTYTRGYQSSVTRGNIWQVKNYYSYIWGWPLIPRISTERLRGRKWCSWIPHVPKGGKGMEMSKLEHAPTSGIIVKTWTHSMACPPPFLQSWQRSPLQ